MHLNTNDEENKADPNPVMCGDVFLFIFKLNPNDLHSKLPSLLAWMGKSGCNQMTGFESFKSRDANDHVLVLTSVYQTSLTSA